VGVVELHHPLAVITPTVDGDVLAVLARAEAAFTGREVHRLAGRYSEAGVRNALTRLVEQGVVLVERVGPSYAYRLNRDHLAATHIIALAGLRAEFLARLRSRLAGWDPPPAFAALFGSAARADMRAGSDIDLFVVRPDGLDPDDEPWAAQRDELVADVTRWTGNDTRPLEYGDTEARRALRRGEAVLQAIKAEGIHLAGPTDYLRTTRAPSRTPARRTARG
jgi:nucleotidyltransferase-like protein